MTIDEAVAKLALDGQIAQGELQQHEKQWVVSSPGKVILFGEHAVVYGVPALAASVSLRCYAIATPHTESLSRTVGVRFVDIDAGDKEGGFRYEWDIGNLPWQAVPGESLHHVPGLFTHPLCNQSRPKPAKFLLTLSSLRNSPELRFQRHWGPMHARPVLRSCIYTWCLSRTLKTRPSTVFFLQRMRSLMHYVHCDYRPSFTLTVRATLPVGAGLGSSAAFSVCATTALMLITGRISLPSDSDSSSSLQEPDRLPRSLADIVNVYAFLSEKILHGNPSGVDNSVAVYGGGLLYTKSIPSEGREGGMVPIEGYVTSAVHYRYLVGGRWFSPRLPTTCPGSLRTASYLRTPVCLEIRKNS